MKRTCGTCEHRNTLHNICIRAFMIGAGFKGAFSYQQACKYYKKKG